MISILSATVGLFFFQTHKIIASTSVLLDEYILREFRGGLEGDFCGTGSIFRAFPINEIREEGRFIRPLGKVAGTRERIDICETERLM